MTFGANILILFILLVLLLTIQLKKETFLECKLVNRYNINSVDTNIYVSKSKYDYEIPISEFRKIIGKISATNYLKRINNTIKETSKFVELYNDTYEVVIYRYGRAFGYHLILSKPHIKVIGVVINPHGVVKHTNKKKETLVDKLDKIKSDPRLFAYYSGSSSS